MLKLWPWFFYVDDYLIIPFMCTKFHGILNWSLLRFQLEYLCGYINNSSKRATRIRGMTLFPIFVMYVPDFVGKIKFCVKVMQEESLIMCGCGNLDFSQLCIWKEMTVSSHLKKIRIWNSQSPIWNINNYGEGIWSPGNKAILQLQDIMTRDFIRIIVLM